MTKIFITGIYRSGTTLLSRILNNHSKLWVTYDSVHFMRFSYDKFSPLKAESNVKKLVLEISNRIRRRWHMEFDVPGTLKKISYSKNISYGLVFDLIMKALIARNKPGAVGWGEKTNVCWGQIPNFLRMFPSGKAIHIIRDPRDVMCSYRNVTYESGFRYLDSAFCSLSAFQAADRHQKIFGKKYIYILRYESLLKNPRNETKKICQFLGIPFEKGMLTVQNFTDKKGGWWAGNSSFEPPLTSISTNPIGRWKTEAKPFEIFIAETFNRDYFEKYNYEQSQIPMSDVEKKRALKIISKDSLLRSRYKHWKMTGEGTEAHPSDPLKK